MEVKEVMYGAYGGDGSDGSGSHLSPVFLPYTCINMLCKKTFMIL
jgi:hypothetical protein